MAEGDYPKNASSEDSPISTAIVGGGIVGLVLALGLLKRGISVKIYEQAQSFHEIGAGVAFTANAQQCMHLLEPRILESMQRVATKNPHDSYMYVDGYHKPGSDPHDMHEDLLFEIYAGKAGFDGLHRAHFLDEMVKFLPEGVVEFRKRLQTYEDPGDGTPIRLLFEDGTSAEADFVVGCDGIKSKVRQVMLGKDNPASYARYTGKAAYRGLIPMDKAVAALGKEKAMSQCMHMGPNAHVLNFPIAMHTMMNVVAFVDDPTDWTALGKMTAITDKNEVIKGFENWGFAVRTIVDLLPDDLTKWAIFDMYDHPAPAYAQGRVCIAGDAAHAASPHHGAGAGFGIEDALVMGTVLEEAVSALKRGQMRSKSAALEAAAHAYNAVRLERSQWLVRSSREVCDVYEWAYQETGIDPEKCKAEIEWRAHKIWYLDIEQMTREAREEFARNI